MKEKIEFDVRQVVDAIGIDGIIRVLNAGELTEFLSAGDAAELGEMLKLTWSPEALAELRRVLGPTREETYETLSKRVCVNCSHSFGDHRGLDDSCPDYDPNDPPIKFDDSVWRETKFEARE